MKIGRLPPVTMLSATRQNSAVSPKLDLPFFSSEVKVLVFYFGVMSVFNALRN